MKYYPVFLDLRRKNCLVAGGGSVAERKIRSLLAAGAKVVCVSDGFSPGILKLSRKKNLTLRKEKIPGSPFSGWLLKNVFLVIGATSSPAVNAGIFKACRKKNILVNAVDDAGHSNFIAASVLNRGLLSIAVSTGGASPLLAKKIRERLEKMFGPECDLFLRFMARQRQGVMARVRESGRRKKIFEALTGPKFFNLFKSARPGTIAKKYREILKRHGVGKKKL